MSISTITSYNITLGDVRAILHPSKRAFRADKRAPCTLSEIRSMRQMRFDGLTLQQIGTYLDRSAPCVQKYAGDVVPCDNTNNAHWKKDRVTSRNRGEFALV